MLFSKNKKRPDKQVKWRAVFAESGFIGLSIILAFALQDWDEMSDIEERMMIALCNVKSELEFNRVLLEGDHLPRQNGMLAIINGAFKTLNSGAANTTSVSGLKDMHFQKSLRYSAWTLAGESGYLLHANFELATEIGALFHYQKDSYQPVIARLNDNLFNSSSEYLEKSIEHYALLKELVNESIAQSLYLKTSYDALFEREDFKLLPCQ
jgi:hypothetical protein